jgi:hypothetical protein
MHTSSDMDIDMDMDMDIKKDIDGYEYGSIDEFIMPVLMETEYTTR